MLLVLSRKIIKGTRGLENKRKSGEHPNIFIIEIGQNTEDSPGDLRRLAVTESSAKDQNSQEVNNDNFCTPLYSCKYSCLI